MADASLSTAAFPMAMTLSVAAVAGAEVAKVARASE